MQIRRCFYSFILLILAFSFVLFSPVNVNAASSNKDVILVLDTSLSMKGYGSGARDIFETVKNSVNVYINTQLQDGDKVTFVTFDEEVKAFPRIMLDDQNDKDILKKYISMTEAHGAWTHMLLMCQQVFALAKNLTDENAASGEKREVVIVIMTDGLDDPPPGKETFTLKSVAEQYQGSDWWIYVVNLSEMEKTGKISSSLAQFRTDLQTVSDKTLILDGSDPNKAINEDMKADMDKRNFIQQKVIPAIAVILALAILIGLFIYLRLKKLQIKGSLEYWNHELLKPEVYRVDLAPLGAREIIVGRVLGCNVKLRDFESRFPFSLKAKSQKGSVVLMLLHAEGLEVGFKNKEYDGIVNNGDIFTASNFSFRYLSE
ncbi:MAG TPA: VWA domain-containing protein [Spirochaetota bacterium]|nr:VWA domain-containing protein [Spirochaetota bacterium]